MRSGTIQFSKKKKNSPLTPHIFSSPFVRKKFVLNRKSYVKYLSSFWFVQTCQSYLLFYCLIYSYFFASPISNPKFAISHGMKNWVNPFFPRKTVFFSYAGKVQNQMFAFCQIVMQIDPEGERETVPPAIDGWLWIIKWFTYYIRHMGPCHMLFKKKIRSLSRESAVFFSSRGVEKFQAKKISIIVMKEFFKKVELNYIMVNQIRINSSRRQFQFRVSFHFIHNESELLYENVFSIRCLGWKDWLRILEGGGYLFFEDLFWWKSVNTVVVIAG